MCLENSGKNLGKQERGGKSRMKRPAGKGNRSRDSSSFVVRVEEVRMDVDAFKLRTCFVFVVKFPQHPYVIHLCS